MYFVQRTKQSSCLNNQENDRMTNHTNQQANQKRTSTMHQHNALVGDFIIIITTDVAVAVAIVAAIVIVAIVVVVFIVI